MLKLPEVDLIIIDCIHPEQALKTINICTDKVKFGNVHFFTDAKINTKINTKKINHVKIDKIKNLAEYSNFCVNLKDYCNNDFALIVQNDGFIVNENFWTDQFLDYDYIGAPWDRTMVTGHRIGNGGFSLRSKKFLEYCKTFESTKDHPEDVFFCVMNYDKAIDFGIKFPPLHVASEFAFETYHPRASQYYPEKHFGFHGKHNIDTAMEFILKNSSKPI